MFIVQVKRNVQIISKSINIINIIIRQPKGIYKVNHAKNTHNHFQRFHVVKHFHSAYQPDANSNVLGNSKYPDLGKLESAI